MLTLLIIKGIVYAGLLGLVAFVLSRIDRRTQVRRMHYLRKQ